MNNIKEHAEKLERLLKECIVAAEANSRDHYLDPDPFYRAASYLKNSALPKCATCNGAGSVMGKRCNECLGRGH